MGNKIGLFKYKVLSGLLRNVLPVEKNFLLGMEIYICIYIERIYLYLYHIYIDVSREYTPIYLYLYHLLEGQERDIHVADQKRQSED